jgi:hypothetical protein
MKPSEPPSSLNDKELSKKWAKETKRLVNTLLGKALFAGHEPAHPISIKWVKMDTDEWGDASLKNYKAGATFVIRLNRDLLSPHPHSRDLALFVFIHELAHCMAWAANETAEESRTRVHGDHGAIWAAEHGALWESLLE